MAVITTVENINIKAWREFVNKHPNGSIFLTPEMFNVYKQTPNYEPSIFVFVDSNLSVICGLLIAVRIQEKKKLIGCLTARTIIYGGPLTNGDALVARRLLLEYDKVSNRKTIYTQVRNLFNQKNLNSIFGEVGYRFEDHLNILLDLTKYNGNIWQGY